MKFDWDFSELENFAKQLGNETILDEAMKEILLEIAKKLLGIMKKNTPVEDGTLIGGWDDESALAVTNTKDGYEVKIVNKTEYARYVNDGHYSFNKLNKGGKPYVVHNRTVMFDETFGGDYPNDDTYVFGRFFVEHSILEMTEAKEVEKIIMQHLEEWWEKCLNGQ